MNNFLIFIQTEIKTQRTLKDMHTFLWRYLCLRAQQPTGLSIRLSPMKIPQLSNNQKCGKLPTHTHTERTRDTLIHQAL